MLLIRTLQRLEEIEEPYQRQIERIHRDTIPNFQWLVQSHNWNLGGPQGHFLFVDSERTEVVGLAHLKKYRPKNRCQSSFRRRWRNLFSSSHQQVTDVYLSTLTSTKAIGPQMIKKLVPKEKVRLWSSREISPDIEADPQEKTLLFPYLFEKKSCLDYDQYLWQVPPRQLRSIKKFWENMRLQNQIKIKSFNSWPSLFEGLEQGLSPEKFYLLSCKWKQLALFHHFVWVQARDQHGIICFYFSPQGKAFVEWHHFSTGDRERPFSQFFLSQLAIKVSFTWSEITQLQFLNPKPWTGPTQLPPENTYGIVLKRRTTWSPIVREVGD